STDFVYISLDTLRERHLDAYGVDLGIVEPDEAAVFSVLPNAQLAARLASGYNDWLLERFLQEEPRLRGMIVVAAQYPEAGGRGRGDPPDGRARRVRRRLPARRRARPVREPGLRPDLGGGQRPRPAGRGAHALREHRDRRARHRGGDARPLRRVPHALRLRD